MKKSNSVVPQSTFHVKAGDEVVILSGSSRGRRGKVLRVMRETNRVIVEGQNFVKKAVRKNPEKPEGGFLEREGALHISKVMLASNYDASKKRPAKTTETK